MTIISGSTSLHGMSNGTHRLMQRMLNPICGMVQEIGFIKRNKFGARILTAGADITGAHVLLGTENPGRGAYHTGGAGIYLNEPVIKSLGETVERYAQLTYALNMKDECVFASYKDMHSKYENVLQKEYLDLFTVEQLNKTGFPYKQFNESLPLSWIKIPAIDQSKLFWVPAQLLLVGYQVKNNLNEPWYCTAVTTGTAAHTDKASVVLNSILEIIQVDSAIGHWYSNYEIPEIIFDGRTKPMEAVLQKYDSFGRDSIRFFWLKNPDLAGICIACVLEKPEECIPRLSIGLGSSTSLNDALYKAYLEAIGVASLGNILILKDKLYKDKNSEIDFEHIYDIDSNVVMYGLGKNYSRIQQRFNSANKIKASDIVQDILGTKENQLKHLVSSFINAGKELLFLDITNIEARELNFHVSRLWSKDTLGLCFPSAPPKKHPRFVNYGGFAHDDPHPYP